ncbi:MAG: YceI family protein [Bacteroidales bacterium]|jgi:polyisoprenoid-binding protein YceI|nr:YceI family protein [Bacteroidales bacterium]
MKAKSLTNKSGVSSEKDKKNESKKTTTKSTVKTSDQAKPKAKTAENKKTVAASSRSTTKSSTTAKKAVKPTAKATTAKVASKSDTKTTGKSTATKAGSKKETVQKSTAAGKGKEKKINVSSSRLRWKGSEPAGSHTGTIGLKEGSLHVKDNKITGGRVIIDMSTIVCEETNEELGRNLKAHLEGGDFFDIEKYPYGEFEIKSIKSKGDHDEITGNLTLKNVTKSVTFPAQINYTEHKVKCYSSNFLIDRTAWGIHYGSANFFRHLADSFIDDHIEIGLLIETE